MSNLRRGRWSTPELVRLRRLFPRTEIDRIARVLSRTAESVRAQGRRLFEREPELGPWTDESDATLRRAYGVVDFRDLAVVLGRSVEAIRERALELRGEQRRGPWQPDEVTLLKELYPSRLDRDLEVCLSRPCDEIAELANRLCLRKDKAAGRIEDPVTMPRWSAPEVERLRELYPTSRNIDIAREIGRSVTSVANKAHQLGLKKCEAMRQEIGASNAAGRSRPPIELEAATTAGPRVPEVESEVDGSIELEPQVVLEPRPRPTPAVQASGAPDDPELADRTVQDDSILARDRFEGADLS